MVPTCCLSHIPLPPAPWRKHWPAQGDLNLNLIPPGVHLYLPLGPLPASSHLSTWGCFSLQPLELPVVTLSTLPGTGWGVSSWF